MDGTLPLGCASTRESNDGYAKRTRHGENPPAHFRCKATCLPASHLLCMKWDIMQHACLGRTDPHSHVAEHSCDLFQCTEWHRAPAEIHGLWVVLRRFWLSRTVNRFILLNLPMIHVPIHFFEESIHSMSRFLESFGTFHSAKVVIFLLWALKMASLAGDGHFSEKKMLWKMAKII